MNDEKPQATETPAGAASVLGAGLEPTALCWNCNAIYPMTADQCPKCCATNAKVDFESVNMEALENSHIDHDWKHRDDSFEHEFGTERVWYFECERCGATREMEPGDYSEEHELYGL